MFVLSFCTHNAAFEEDPRTEAAHMLNTIAMRLGCGATNGPVYDTNGNRIGYWSFEFNPGE